MKYHKQVILMQTSYFIWIIVEQHVNIKTSRRLLKPESFEWLLNLTVSSGVFASLK